jgi:hypothetical protein
VVDSDALRCPSMLDLIDLNGISAQTISLRIAPQGEPSIPCRDALVKNLKRARKTLEREGKDPSVYNFFPQTFVLPQEYSMFTDEFRKEPGESKYALAFT